MLQRNCPALEVRGIGRSTADHVVLGSVSTEPRVDLGPLRNPGRRTSLAKAERVHKASKKNTPPGDIPPRPITVALAAYKYTTRVCVRSRQPTNREIKNTPPNNRRVLANTSEYGLQSPKCVTATNTNWLVSISATSVRPLFQLLERSSLDQ